MFKYTYIHHNSRTKKTVITYLNDEFKSLVKFPNRRTKTGWYQRMYKRGSLNNDAEINYENYLLT